MTWIERFKEMTEAKTQDEGSSERMQELRERDLVEAMSEDIRDRLAPQRKETL